MLGLHVNKITPSTRRQVLAHKWRLVKFLDEFDAGLLAQLKAQNPAVVAVGRIYYPPAQDITPEDAVARITALPAAVKGLIDYWEVYNEILGDQNVAEVNQKNIQCAALLHAAGLKYCALSLAVGTPAGSDADIKAKLDILWPGVAASDAWSYHCYAAETVLTSAEWLALRYRRYVALDPRYGTKSMIGSEAGIDFVTIGQQGGWRKHGTTTADYARQLLAFQEELVKDPYVLGVALFQSGDDTDPQAATDGDETWGSYNIGEDVTDLIGPHVAPAPQPPPADPHLAYFGQYGHTPNADSALYKFALLPLRLHYEELLSQGKTDLANLVNPGPCTSEEYKVTEKGITKYRRHLTNRTLEVQVINGIWTPFQVETNDVN